VLSNICIEPRARKVGVYVINKMTTSEECAKSSSNISKQSSRQRLSLETSLENLRKLSSSLEAKKTPKRSNFFLSYDSSGKRIRSEYKYRSVAERTTHKKRAVHVRLNYEPYR
jgi:hypothetical protein